MQAYSVVLVRNLAISGDITRRYDKISGRKCKKKKFNAQYQTLKRKFQQKRSKHFSIVHEKCFDLFLICDISFKCSTALKFLNN